jgi:hypothetical protein
MSDRWRGVVASLLNPDLRVALAEVILDADSPLSAPRRERARARLIEVGLLREDANGPHFDESAVRSILNEAPVTKVTGAQRYLTGDGRIDRYPVREADRLELLAWVASRAFRSGDVLTEQQVNERLSPFTDDVAVLRRYLVDYELLERTRSGSEYAPAAGDG